MDYGAEPPEINSGRIYSGVGPGPMLAAAAAWSALGGELEAAAAAHGGTTAGLLAGPWIGPSAVNMGASGAQSVAWLMAASAQCFEASAACNAAAAQFAAAFAGVTPPVQITENRTRLATLIATNFMGVNSPAIAECEAEYAEMWAQTSSTLYSYAADSAATAGSMVPLVPPAPNTNPAGMAAQAAATSASTGQSAGTSSQTVSGLMSSLGQLPQAASSLTQGGGPLGGFTKALQGLSSPLQSLMQPLQSLGKGFAGPLNGIAGSFASFAPMMSGMSGVSGAAGLSGSTGFVPGMNGIATMGRSATLPGGSNLSVPAQWVSSSQPAKAMASVAQPLEANEVSNNGWVGAPRSGVGGMPVGAMGGANTTPGVAPNWMGDIRQRSTDEGGLRSKLIGDLTGI